MTWANQGNAPVPHAGMVIGRVLIVRTSLYGIVDPPFCKYILLHLDIRCKKTMKQQKI